MAEPSASGYFGQPSAAAVSYETNLNPSLFSLRENKTVHILLTEVLPTKLKHFVHLVAVFYLERCVLYIPLILKGYVNHIQDTLAIYPCTYYILRVHNLFD